MTQNQKTFSFSNLNNFFSIPNINLKYGANEDNEENVLNYEQEDANSNMTLANRLRIAFQDMNADTICGKFPKAELPLKRRLRCVAEYLIRSGEFNKVRDKDGKLIKKRGILGKMVVLYQPMPKLLESLTRQGLLKK